MAEHENATRLRKGYEAFASGDFAALDEFIPEDAVWHVTGNNPFSGDYKGRAEVYGYFGQLVQVSGGTFKAELLHVTADDEYGFAIQRSTATINGKDVATTDILVDRVVDGQAVETWIYLEDNSVFEGITLD